MRPTPSWLALVVLALTFACATTGGRSGPTETPERALARFLDAAEAGDFARALEGLTASWRARYTPETFARDFGRAPGATTRLAKARAALQAGAQRQGDEAIFPLEGGRAVRLTREGNFYRVAALE